MGKKKAKVPNQCVACGACVKACPLGVMSVYKGMYAKAGDNCAGCGKCEDACPAGLIFMDGGNEIEEKALV